MSVAIGQIYELFSKIEKKAYLHSLRMLKPCQNKKGQSFVVMFGFCMFFKDLHQVPAAKKERKKRASQQTFGCSYFVRALAIPNFDQIFPHWN